MTSKKCVVAWYKEKIEWVEKIPIPTVVYRKSEITSPDFKGVTVLDLPNIGREGHTYLTHIIDNYENLEDITFFLQGNPWDHVYNHVEKKKEALFEEIKSLDQDWSHLGSRMDPVSWEQMVKTNMFRGLRKKYINLCSELGVKPRESFSSGACFAVSSNIVRQYEPSIYEHMREQSLSFLGGYAIEMMWYAMFSKNICFEPL